MRGSSYRPAYADVAVSCPSPSHLGQVLDRHSAVGQRCLVVLHRAAIITRAEENQITAACPSYSTSLAWY